MGPILVAIRGMLEGIREASPAQFIMLCAFPALITVLLLRLGIKWRHVSRLIARTPVVPIGSAVEGIAAVEGTSEPGRGSPLTATLTGTACVWYRTLVERMDVASNSRGMRSAGWSKRSGTESRAPFLLRDGSGVCEVRALGDYVTPTDRSVWFGATKEPQDRQPEKYPGSMPLSEVHAKLSGNEKQFRYTEERIYAGDHIYVLGEFFKTPAEDDDEDEERHDLDAADSDEDKAAASEQRRRSGFNTHLDGEKDSNTPSAALRITTPADNRYPLVVSGVGADGARRLHAMRSKGMFIFASFFAAIVGLLSWAHFSH